MARDIGVSDTEFFGMSEKRFIYGPAYTDDGWTVRPLMDRQTGVIHGSSAFKQISPEIQAQMPVVVERLTLREVIGKAIAWLRRDF